VPLDALVIYPTETVDNSIRVQPGWNDLLAIDFCIHDTVYQFLTYAYPEDSIVSFQKARREAFEPNYKKAQQLLVLRNELVVMLDRKEPLSPQVLQKFRSRFLKIQLQSCITAKTLQKVLEDRIFKQKDNKSLEREAIEKKLGMQRRQLELLEDSSKSGKDEKGTESKDGRIEELRREIQQLERELKDDTSGPIDLTLQRAKQKAQVVLANYDDRVAEVSEALEKECSIHYIQQTRFLPYLAFRPYNQISLTANQPMSPVLERTLMLASWSNTAAKANDKKKKKPKKPIERDAVRIPLDFCGLAMICKSNEGQLPELYDWDFKPIKNPETNWQWLQHQRDNLLIKLMNATINALDEEIKQGDVLSDILALEEALQAAKKTLEDMQPTVRMEDVQPSSSSSSKAQPSKPMEE
jgi:hypothetical protein